MDQAHRTVVRKEMPTGEGRRASAQNTANGKRQPKNRGCATNRGEDKADREDLSYRHGMPRGPKGEGGRPQSRAEKTGAKPDDDHAKSVVERGRQ